MRSTTFRYLVHITWLITLLVAGAKAQEPVTPLNRASPNLRVGNITGRVISDSGKLLSNVTVYLRVVGLARSARKTVTDKEGRFKVNGLSPGNYTISAYAPGYVMPDQKTDWDELTTYRLGDSPDIILSKGGVITGRVVNSRSEPMVALNVQSIRVQSLDGKPAGRTSFTKERLTDDRGIYRLYGLEPGIYIIKVGGGSRTLVGVNPYERDSPTFYPSSTQDTAAIIKVESGFEIDNIDVRYRDEPGFAVSGQIIGDFSGNGPVSVSLTLTYSNSGVTTSFTTTTLDDKNRSFALYGIPSGEYNFFIQTNSSAGSAFAITPVTVKGADVNGLKIALTPLGSIIGRLQFDSKEMSTAGACKNDKETLPEEVLVIARRNKSDNGKKPGISMLPDVITNSAGEKGEFSLSQVVGGTYQIDANIPNRNWYIKSIIRETLGSQSNTGSIQKNMIDVSREGLAVKPGEELKNLTITLANGAAFLQGRFTSGKEGLPAQIRLDLVPVDKEYADDALRYVEIVADSNQALTIKNISPGRYWIIAQPSVVNGVNPSSVQSVVWDKNERIKLRQKAEIVNKIIELQPCKIITGYEFSYVAF